MLVQAMDIIDRKAMNAVEGNTLVNKIRTVKYERLLFAKESKRD